VVEFTRPTSRPSFSAFAPGLQRLRARLDGLVRLDLETDIGVADLGLAADQRVLAVEVRLGEIDRPVGADLPGSLVPFGMSKGRIRRKEPPRSSEPACLRA